MEVKELLHMKGGDGEHSYAQNQATFTQKVASRTEHILENAIQSLLSKDSSTAIVGKVLNIADLGCASGPAPLNFISTIVEVVDRTCGELIVELPEIQVFLNDLQSNDFNSIFRDLSTSRWQQVGDGGAVATAVFVMATSGSFHGRLFPCNTLHLVHSGYSAHWLSQVPPGLCTKEGVPINRGAVYISEASPPAVVKAYMAQFEHDFNLFLKCRSDEIVPDGCMFLTLRGRPSVDPLAWEPWELKLFARAFSQLVSQGLIKEERVDSFNFPYFGASEIEIKAIVEKEGSFLIEHVETMAQHVADEIGDKRERAEKLASIIRSYTEPLVSHHFGEQILEPFYSQLAHVVFEFLAKEAPEHFTIAILLKRKTNSLMTK
ncbi:hypothetical protein Nepgr_032409 [Nepenthes gracilis]|uniref:Uncharacterized protein n=1 Tax=Nepenthes gracilis TaxID=150966 RepID=A0AAD3TJZ4_NEPGR|nr:hypothetical protein Nepgr_032409 [Nepenthes gracilis]